LPERVSRWNAQFLAAGSDLAYSHVEQPEAAFAATN
jgi:hypothetical protein